MFSDLKALSASLMEAKSNSRRWELEAREDVEMAVRAESERDTAHHEVAMARLKTEAVGSAQAQVESELAQVQRTLAASEDARRKVDSKLDGAWQALAAFGEAWRKVEEEVSRLTKTSCSLSEQRPLKRRRLWRRSLTLALKLSSIMAMDSMHLHKIFLGVSPRSQRGCLTLQSRYLPRFFINP